jgi:hypothetical protein
VEDRWAIGVLDLILKVPGFPLFLAEGKLIKGNLFAPTQRQWIEGNKWIEADVNAVLLGWKNNTMAVSPWTVEADVRECWTGADHLETLVEYLTDSL